MPAKHNSKEMIGMENHNTNGSLYVIREYNNYHNIIVEFPEFNYKCKTDMNRFKDGKIKCPYDKTIQNIGYIGEGLYKVTDSNNKTTNAYKKWNSMIHRCYDSKCLENRQTYIECSVCEEWFCFQNFAQWYEENYYEIPGEKMELDKDILCKGNKEYGPNTCCFLPKRINSFFTKKVKDNGLPEGVIQRKDYKYPKYSAAIGMTFDKKSNRNYFPVRDTIEEAFNDYKQAKESYIKELADEYIEYLPDNIYLAMYDYEVEITD